MFSNYLYLYFINVFYFDLFFFQSIIFILMDKIIGIDCIELFNCKNTSRFAEKKQIVYQKVIDSFINIYLL